MIATERCRAVLFDLDGVLVDSRECVAQVWRTWAAERGVDPAPFIAVAHGRKISDTIRLVAPGLDARAEASMLDRLEQVETRGLVAFPGAAALLEALAEGERGIVTTGSRAVASLRLRTSGLPIPDVFVTSDDVARGKPDPAGYLLAARRLGVGAAECVVVEDSPTGIRAARDAGMRVIAVQTTHDAPALAEAGARVPALADLRVRRNGDRGGGLALEFPAERTAKEAG